MRIVVASIPQAGHVTPLIPLAEAFRDQGDEVVFASGPDAEPAVTQRQLEFRRVGPAFGEWFEALQGRTRGMPGDGLPPERIEHYFLPRLFGEIGTAMMIDDLLDVCRTVDAEMVVFDLLVFAGPLVASVLGIPGVHHTLGPVLEPDVLQLVADAVSPIWREFARSCPAAAGMYEGTTVSICPPTLDPDAVNVGGIALMRPVPLPQRPTEPPVALPPGDSPVVYVTLGTFSNNPSHFRVILDAVASEPVRLVVTVGRDVEPDDLRPFPPNAQVERFVPQADLLPHCDAAIHHAGAGTAFGIVAHGLPSVAIPQSADNFVIAERLAASGAAVSLMPDGATPDAIEAALREVVRNSSYRAAAEILGREIASMPAPAEVAARLRG